MSAALAEAKDVLHDILHASAVADGMIDFEQDGEAKFEEWFDGLPFLPTLGLLMSKCLEWTEAQQPLAIAYRETAKRSWAKRAEYDSRDSLRSGKSGRARRTAITSPCRRAPSRHERRAGRGR